MNYPLPPSLPILVDLTEISTPREMLLSVKPGPVDEAVLQQAQDGNYKQLPVLTVDGDLAGLIPTRKLQMLFDHNEEVSAEKAEIRVPEMPDEVALEDLIADLVQHRAVVHRGTDGEDRPANWFGLVTAADLNRPIFRAHVYRLMVTIETALGNVIMEEFDDDWGAVRLLSGNTQGRIREYYEEERKNGVDLSPLTTVTLSDLLFIARASNKVWQLLGYASAKEMEPASHQINELRNRIMHPIRPLVVVENDLTTLQEGVDQAIDVAQRSERHLFGEGDAEPTTTRADVRVVSRKRRRR